MAQGSTHRETYGFKGAVRTVISEETKYENRSGRRVEGPRKISSKFAFDVDGFFLEDVRYIGDGRKSVTSYEKGKTTDTVYAADGSIESKEVTTLGEGQRITGITYYDRQGALTHKKIYRYEADRPLGIETYSADMTLLQKEIYVYNSRGLSAIEQYDGEGTLLDRRSYESEIRDNRSESLSYDADGTYRGKIVSPVFTDGPKGRISERLYYSANGSLERREVFTESEDGRIAERAAYKSDGSLDYKWRAVYEYDSYGNWTKETKETWVTKNGKSFFEPTYVTYRTITYY